MFMLLEHLFHSLSHLPVWKWVPEFWCVYTPHPVLLRTPCQLVVLRKQHLSCQSVCFVLCIVSVHGWVPELSSVLLRAAHQLVALRKQHLCCWSICFILYPTYLSVNGYLELWCAYTPHLVPLRTACKLAALRKQPSICFTLYPTYRIAGNFRGVQCFTVFAESFLPRKKEPVKF